MNIDIRVSVAAKIRGCYALKGRVQTLPTINANLHDAKRITLPDGAVGISFSITEVAAAKVATSDPATDQAPEGFTV